MIKLFKSTHLAYLASVIIGSVGILILANHFIIAGKEVVKPIINSYLQLPLIFIWMFISAYAFNYIATKKIDKITSILTKECRVKDYINYQNNLLKKIWDTNTRTFLFLNLSTGYMTLGDTYSAKKVLDAIKSFANNRMGALSRACYYNNLIAYDLRINDLENAAQHIEDFRTALDNPKLKEMDRESYYHLYITKKFLLNIAKGFYDGAEELFHISFDKGKDALAKVSAKYTLGKVYLHDNQPEKATESFEYVLKNGGDSYYVEEAKNFLNNIKETDDFLGKSH